MTPLTFWLLFLYLALSSFVYFLALCAHAQQRTHILSSDTQLYYIIYLNVFDITSQPCNKFKFNIAFLFHIHIPSVYVYIHKRMPGA